MKNKKGPSFGQAGEILIEALLGLVITMVIITGLIVALSASVSNSTFSTNQSQATLVAKEGLDLIKNIKEDDFASIDLTGYYCLNSSRVLVSGVECPEDVETDSITFLRQFYISSNGIDYRKNPATPACSEGGRSVLVASIVSWWDSKCGSNINTKCHKIELNSCFTDLSQI